MCSGHFFVTWASPDVFPVVGFGGAPCCRAQALQLAGLAVVMSEGPEKGARESGPGTQPVRVSRGVSASVPLGCGRQGLRGSGRALRTGRRWHLEKTMSRVCPPPGMTSADLRMSRWLPCLLRVRTSRPSTLCLLQFPEKLTNVPMSPASAFRYLPLPPSAVYPSPSAASVGPAVCETS